MYVHLKLNTTFKALKWNHSLQGFFIAHDWSDTTFYEGPIHLETINTNHSAALNSAQTWTSV